MAIKSKQASWRHVARRFLLTADAVWLSEQPMLFRFGAWSCYGFAVGAVILALVTTYTVPPLREQPPTLLFFVAVILTSWYAGLRAGFVASVLAMLALDLFFVSPAFSFQMEIVEDGADFVAFATATWIVSAFQDRWRQTHRKLVAVEQEMQIARRIQQRFFPATAPALSGLDIAGGCFPAGDTGGDFFDYIPMPDDRLGIAVGDVSGHGLGPAIVMVLLRAYLRALALTCGEPEQVLARANQLVHRDVEEGWFATVFLIQLDSRSGEFLYAGAGHEGYLLDSSGGVTKLESTGIPLGIDPGASISQSVRIPLKSGQVLLLLSDGIVECHSSRGDAFGLARVLETVRAHCQEPAQKIASAIHQAACSHRGNQLAQEDDMTMVILKAG